jgi:hypothetical protein
MMKRTSYLALAAAAALLPTAVFASPSGLNNIPTADTPGHREGVFQWFSTFPTAGKADHWMGFKTGLRPFGAMHRFEGGFDSHLAPDESGPVVFQFKYAVQPWTNLPTLGLGSANLALTSEDRDRAGQPFSYAMLTHDFGWLRAHAGYALQHGNNTALLGLDKTVKLFDRDLTLRGDFRQIDDEDQWLGSAGFLYHFHKNVALESWVSQPTSHGPTSFTIKLNLIFRY